MGLLNKLFWSKDNWKRYIGKSIFENMKNAIFDSIFFFGPLIEKVYKTNPS